MKIKTALRLALKSVLSLKFGAVNTDKGTLVYDGEDSIKVGDEVFVSVEGEDEPQVAADGEYIAEDGRTIVVENGVVTEIREKVEETPETEGIENTEVKAEEEAETPADEEEKEEEEVSIEDRLSALEAQVAVIVDGINQIVNSIASMEERIEEVEGKLAKVEAPATNPIEEQPEIEEKKSRLSYLRRD